MDTIPIKRKNIIIKKILKKPEAIIPQVIISQIKNTKKSSKTVILKCPHQKNKRYCKICNPSCYCIHNKIKKNCIVCKPLNYCIHNRRKSACKDCKTGICLHGRYSTPFFSFSDILCCPRVTFETKKSITINKKRS